MHEFFALPTACLVRLHLNADVLGMFELLVQIRKLTSVCLCHQIEIPRQMGSRVKATVPMTLPDDMTRPQHPSRGFSDNIFDSLSSSCADESLTNGNEGAMFARTTKFGPLRALRESCPLEPPSDTTNFRFRTPRPPIVTKAESLENVCLDMKDYEKIGSDATHVCWKRRRLIANSTAAMGRHSEKNLSFLELHAVKNSVRYHQALQ